MYSTRYLCPNLIKLEFSGQILEKSSNIKFYENPSSGREGVDGHTGGQTDECDEAILRKSKKSSFFYCTVGC